MKRILLILLFIVIITRIMQQIYFRTNIGQKANNLESEIGMVNRGNTLGVGDNFRQLSIDIDVNTPSLSSYSDIKLLELNTIDNLSIGTHNASSDKHFFLRKRLIDWLKAHLHTSLDSIHVWIGVFSSTREGVVSSIGDTFNRLYHSSISDLVTGLLLGNDIAKKSSNSHLYKVTGTQHLFAISGFHLSFIVAFISNLYSKYFPKSMVILINLVVSLLYVSLVGLSPGLFRAFSMFLISNLAWYCNRQKWAIHSFIFALIIAVLIDIQVLSSVGFQLSYIATLGILVFISLFDNLHDISSSFFTDFSRVGGGILHYFFSSILISFAAQIAVFPLLIYHFHEISLVGIIATSMVSWTIPIIMQYGMFIAFIKFFVSYNFLTLFSLPLFFIAKLLFLLLQLISFETAIIEFSEVSIWVPLFAYFVIGLIYASIFISKRSKTIKKHEEIYHFCP